MQKIFNVLLDTKDDVKNPAFVVNTNDLKTVKINLLINQDGDPLDLTGATVRLAVKKPDKTTVLQDITVVDALAGSCEIVLNTQAYVIDGKYDAEVMVYYGVDTVAVTGQFSYKAVKGILDDGTVESTNEWQSINQAIADAEGILIDLRDNGTGVDAQARADIATHTTQLAEIAKVIQNESQLISAITENVPMKLTIGKNIDITANLTIPRQYTIIFKEIGMLTVKSGVTLTLNGVIDAGYNQIFSFEDATANITATRVSYGHSIGADYPLNGGYKVKPDWFGAIPDGRPANAYNSTYASPVGTDNTTAFKRCMKFAEALSNYYYRDVYANVPTIIVSLRPSSGYIVKGDNPLGIQSTDNTVSYMIQFEGNGSVILWEPSAQTDVLFKKYGRVKYPRIEDLNVLLCTGLTNRWGTFISSKTGESDATHSWTQGIFRNILLGTPFGKSGFNIIFDIEGDNAHAMDDQTLVENVQCTTYNTYIRLANNEAVDWKISKVMFASGTSNAVHVDIKDNFAGGLTIDSCEILMKEDNETFLKTGIGVGMTPIKIQNGRIETREDALKFIFLDLKSGFVDVDGLIFTNANSVSPNINTRTAIIGLGASVKFSNCTLFEYIDLWVNNDRSGVKEITALDCSHCTFYGSLDGVPRSFGYPRINYINATTALPITIEAAIRGGKFMRSMTIRNPKTVDGFLGLPVDYGNSIGNLKTQTVEISKHKADGKPSLNIPTLSLPPNIVVTSVKLWLTNVDATKVDTLTIAFYKDGTTDWAPLTKTLTGTANINGEELMLVNKMIVLPCIPVLKISQKLGAAVVTDETLMPSGWIEVSYKSITKACDLGNVDNRPITKDILVFY